MKLTVLTWFKDAFIVFMGRVIEITFRILLLFLPMGLFLLLIQQRDKASKVSNLSVFTTDESTWQHIFPGFILVAIDPKILHKRIAMIHNSIEIWGSAHKYLLTMIVMVLLVLLMFLKGGY